MKPILFDSTNKAGIHKADLIANLTDWKGVTRREPKNIDMCEINRDFLSKLKGSGLEHTFFPLKYTIGTVHPIAKRELQEGEKEGDNVLCVCGKEKNMHNESTFSMQGTEYLKFDKNTRKQKALMCKTINEMLDSDKKSGVFKPILLKVTSGMWHTDWVKKEFDFAMACSCNIQMAEQVQKSTYEKEAKLEGFGNWQEVLDYFEDKGKDINKQWRVGLGRIQ